MKEVETVRGFSGYNSYALFCVDGVEYIRTPSGVAGHFKPDGSLYACKVKGE